MGPTPDPASSVMVFVVIEYDGSPRYVPVAVARIVSLQYIGGCAGQTAYCWHWGGGGMFAVSDSVGLDPLTCFTTSGTGAGSGGPAIELQTTFSHLAVNVSVDTTLFAPKSAEAVRATDWSTGK